MKTYHYIVISFFFFACQYGMQPREIISSAREIMEENPDSASILLLQIEDPEQLSPQNKADYWVTKSIIRFIKGEALQEDTMILFSLQYYKEQQQYDNLPITYFMALSHYRWNDDAENRERVEQEALYFFLKKKDSVNVANLYDFMGNEKRSNQQHTEEVEYYKNGIRFTGFQDPHYYYETGLAYAFLAEKDSSSLYINRSVDLSMQKGDTAGALHYIRNYADILRGQKRYEEALFQSRRVLGLTDTPRPGMYTTITEIYLLLHKLDSAQYYLDKAQEMVIDNVTHYNLAQALQAIIDYTRSGEVNTWYMNRYNEHLRVEMEDNAYLMREKVDINKELEHKRLILKVRNQHIQIILMAVLLLIVLCSGFIYIFIRNKQLKLQEAQEKMEAFQSLLSNTLKENPDEKDVLFKKVLLQQLGLIRLVATSPTAQNQELLKQISRIANEDVPVDLLLAWDDLYGIIDSVYDNFYSKLLDHYGEALIEREIQLCCLLCAEFSTKEISVVTQQSVRTVYQRKTTIRQKLHMDEKDDIILFLNSAF